MKKPLYELSDEQKAKVKYYIIFKCPNSPFENGTFIGKTPIFEQALAAVEGYCEKGKSNGDVYGLKAELINGKIVNIH